jgi:hypothetical protein
MKNLKFDTLVINNFLHFASSGGTRVTTYQCPEKTHLLISCEKIQSFLALQGNFTNHA